MRTVINVGGTSRSGSTMLHLILGNAPNAFATGAPMNRFRPTMRHHFDLECSCGRHPCPVWRRFDGVTEKRFYAAAFEELDVDYVIDSSKELSWLLDARSWNARQGIRTINVFSWKDPLHLAYSYWKRDQGALFWRSEFVKYYQRVIQAGLPLLAVNLEDLTRDPAAMVEKVCSVIGMPYFPGKEAFWGREHHLLGGSLGVRRQAGSGRSSFITDPPFPPEFERQLPALTRQIAADDEVQRLQEVLRRNDVTTMAAGTGLQQVGAGGHPYPSWYYAQRLKRLWRRRFPRDYDLAMAERAATVPGQQGGA